MSDAVTLSGPTQEHERISAIDILRGFALFGILLVNFPGSEAARSGAVDDQIRRLLSFLVSTKFYTTFSFLFGLGFALQLMRARGRHARVVPVYIRRMAALFLIGLCHAIFIWHGDILLLYAVMGFLLIPFRNRSGKILLIFVGLSLAADFAVGLRREPVLISALLPNTHSPETEQVRSIEQALGFTRTGEAYWAVDSSSRFGTYPQAIAARLQLLLAQSDMLWRYFLGSSFAMFLLGLYAGRRGILHDLPGHRGLLRKIMWAALPVALALNLVVSYGPQLLGAFYYQIPQWGTSLLGVLAGPSGSLFYISALFLLLVRSERWTRRLRFLSWVGRMPLTNYLTQSVVGTTVYYGYGLGLHSRLGYLDGLLLRTAIFAAQIPLSRWWLSRFQFGPCEWLWRAMTYGKPQPWRARAAAGGRRSAQSLARTVPRVPCAPAVI